jgi:xanthine dehydrogenase small subunit
VIELRVDGRAVSILDADLSLLEALRDVIGVRDPKDGCSPQGQCGCCTVLVDGEPRVACVTPVRRVAGRDVVTTAGLPADERDAWATTFAATGASQCGFCTPGIVLRLAALRARHGGPPPDAAVARALLAHLCRCTGWRTILEASRGYGTASVSDRDREAAARRATLEGRTPQRVGPAIPLGDGGFADDTAPADALVAIPDGRGGWAVAESLAEARAAVGKVQGRRTTRPAVPPLDAPAGEWDAVLRTCWVEPAYLEPDASWCAPGGTPATPLANGGAFGGKAHSPVTEVARRLADEHGRAVRVLLSREDTVRMGPKRPPVAGGARADGSGVMRVVRTPGIAAAINAVAPTLAVDEVDVAGPPTSTVLRAAGWAEAHVLLSGARRSCPPVRSPDGATAEAEVTASRIAVRVACGETLDEVVLRSYCIGAAHMALSWVTGEGLAVDEDGAVQDLTIRSFGVLRAVDMPAVDVTIDAASGPPVNGSDAVFAAVAAAVWLDRGCPADWPVSKGVAR